MNNFRLESVQVRHRARDVSSDAQRFILRERRRRASAAV